VSGVLLGLAAVSTTFGWSNPSQWVPDLVVGWAFLACGLVARSRRPESWTGQLMIATGFTWFLGSFAAVDVRPIAWLAAHSLYFHRGPLIHCVLSFPTGRLASRLDMGTVAVGYLAAVVTPIAQSEIAVIALGLLLVAVATRGYIIAIGPARRARAVVVRAAASIGFVLSGGAAARLTFPAGDANEAVLLAYEVVLCAVAVGLLVGLLRASWEQAMVTDLVVELAETRSGTLREALARALGDPTIEVGYWLPESEGYVDARGRPVDLSEVTGRAVTPIEWQGRPLVALVHDPAVLDDPGLLESIASAARLAASNARLQAEVRAQLAEVEASRRRLVETATEERRRLERRLREGAERRLNELAVKLARARYGARRSGTRETLEQMEQAGRQLRRTLDDLRELARGLHPSALEECGLTGALSDLTQRSPVPIELDVSAPQLPRDVEAAAYFVCLEALANMGKYASASCGAIKVERRSGRLMIVIVDDGVGGADIRKGSGLRGLADRVEALGGTFRVESGPGSGTRLTAEIPLGGDAG
jgi:signal transduction histidine kinase